MVMLINDETLAWKAQSIIGEQFLLVRCETENPYTELKSTIEDCGVSNIILEAQTLNTIFDVAVLNANIKVFQYSIISFMYIIVLVLITLFETTVYYENNKRMLTIKKIHGYGYRAYEQFALNKAFIFAAILALAIFLNYNLYFAILAVLIDFFVFAYYIRKLEKNSIVLYLKGDM